MLMDLKLCDNFRLFCAHPDRHDRSKPDLKRLHSTVCLFVIFFISIATFIITPLASAQQPITILIVPFKIHSQQDMSFLNSGIASMLTSRLAREGAVAVIPAEVEPGNDPAARAYAQKLQADYLLTGNLTIFGNAVSTDASFYDIKDGTVAVKFDEYGKNSGDVLAHIDKLAVQINQQVLDKQLGDPAASAKAIAVTPVPVVISAEPKADAVAPVPVVTSAEPKADVVSPSSTAETKAVTGQTAVVVAPVVAAPAQETPQETAAPAATTAATTPSVWKSQTFKFNVDGLTVADVDGDGQNETVFIGGGNVHVYRLSNDKLAKVHVYKAARHLHLLGVDAVDLNKNGRAEIFITSLSRRGNVGSTTKSGGVDRLGSFVLEWEGTGLQPVADDLRYYFRAIDSPGRGRILLGQKRGIVGSADWIDTIDGKDQLFVKGIYPLEWRDGVLEEGDRLDLPGAVNVFGFTAGEIFNDGRKMIAMETESRYLKILSPERRVEWESGERYGGSTRYLEYPAMSGREPDRYYLPQRMIVADTNQDGKNDFLVVKNDDSSRGVLGRVKVFRNGRAEILSWSGVTMHQQWQSDVMAGFISDLAWADMDNDGHAEIALAIGPKGGSSDSSMNYILTYDLK